MWLNYEEEARSIAINLGKQFRKKGMRVELVRKIASKTVEEYMAYGKRHQNNSILYVKEDGTIETLEN